MKKGLATGLFLLLGVTGMAMAVTACSEDTGGGDNGCDNDNDCKGDRVCSNGQCVGDGGNNGGNNGGGNNGGGNNGGGNNGGGNNGGGNNGGGNNGGPDCSQNDPAGDSCNSADACTVGCLCGNDNGVASGTCINGRCASASDTCEEACADDGGWANQFCYIGDGGGNNGGVNNGGGNNGGGNNGGVNNGGNNGGGDDFGEVCQANNECNRNVCLFSGDVDFGYCSAPCESFTDCPTFWDCEEVGNGSGTFCVQD